MPGRFGDEVVRVEGLADLQRELRRLDSKLPRELRLANLKAAEVVATAARSKASSLGSVAAKTAPSIKAAAEQRRSKVTLGGPKYPFAMGAEFGSIEYAQFKPWTGSDSSSGYFFYPAIRGTREEFMATYERALDQLMRAAFPN